MCINNQGKKLNVKYPYRTNNVLTTFHKLNPWVNYSVFRIRTFTNA